MVGQLLNNASDRNVRGEGRTIIWDVNQKLEGDRLSKATNNLRRDSQFPDRDLNPGSPRCEAVTLSTGKQRLVQDKKKEASCREGEKKYSGLLEWTHPQTRTRFSVIYLSSLDSSSSSLWHSISHIMQTRRNRIGFFALTFVTTSGPHKLSI